MLKIAINKTTNGTHIIVDHDIDNAVALLSIPYGIKNILVLVIGSNEFIIITANHTDEIKFKYNKIKKINKVIIGIIIKFKIKICLTHNKCFKFFLNL